MVPPALGSAALAVLLAVTAVLLANKAVSEVAMDAYTVDRLLPP